MMIKVLFHKHCTIDMEYFRMIVRLENLKIPRTLEAEFLTESMALLTCDEETKSFQYLTNRELSKKLKDKEYQVIPYLNLIYELPMRIKKQLSTNQIEEILSNPRNFTTDVISDGVLSRILCLQKDDLLQSKFTQVPLDLKDVWEKSIDKINLEESWHAGIHAAITERYMEMSMRAMGQLLLLLEYSETVDKEERN